MKKSTKAILLGIATISVISGLVFISKKRNKKNASSVKEETTSDIALDKNKILSFGSTGDEVKVLQSELGDLVIDGKFGPLTQAQLLKKFRVTKITLNQLEDYQLKNPLIEAIRNVSGKLRDFKTMYKFDLAYLQAWAKAAKDKKQTFDVGFNTYETSTGKIYSTKAVQL